MSTLPPRHHFFLENVNYHLIQHLSDPQLSVKRLIRLVGMSRTDLHRKLDDDRWHVNHGLHPSEETPHCSKIIIG